MKRHNGLPAVVLAAAVILGACGGGGGSSSQPAPKVQLSGTVSSAGYNYKPAPGILARTFSRFGFATMAFAAGGPTPTVNQVLAIPIYYGSLRADNMPNSVTSTINASTGAFSLALAKDRDWLLVLMNTTATGTSRFVGSLALNTDNTAANSLLGLPATNTTSSTINLGAVTRTSSLGDGLSTTMVGTTNFSLSAASLTTMAKTDKMFRNAMNIANNYGTFGGAGKYYQLRPDFHWRGDVTTLVSAGSLSTAPTLTFSSMNFQLDQNVHAPTDNAFMSNVCNVAGFISFHPPVSAPTVTINGIGYNYANPIKNSGNGCSPISSPTGTKYMTDYNGIYASNQYEAITFSVIPSFSDTTIQPGFWEWRENSGATLGGAFDIANINAPLTTAGKVQGFIPVYKLNLGASNKITSVDITWYYNDGSNYVPIPSAEVLKHFVGSVEAKFDVTFGGQRRTCEMYINYEKTPTKTSFDPADPAYASSCQGDPAHKDWYYNNPGAGRNETNIVPGSTAPNFTSFLGIYESGGFGYFFEYW